ncbi:hypothetical protein M3P05_05050 [Sansalvadorimonas sp. 2012CJ34-2]|uniref:Uncharacterized protein n=1 Tax=Parendozoicomonas callyspongiae TaxID=2942213 RepID=A0ABT0PDL7_9GAMM|nr:hypothetical protein [Sansalvadorimonas sp. 2012CJ34-2]MCL6269311.1 hypothetical protein [Sansalvadorimonas sp. 2012CJ34-2]
MWTDQTDPVLSVESVEQVESVPQQAHKHMPVPKIWVVDGSKANEFRSILKYKTLLLVPVMDIQSNGELLPDYIRTAKLYDDLKKSGLKLAPPELSLKWHFNMIAAVEQACPEKAIDPLPSCSSRKWVSSWLPGSGPYFSDDMLFHFLEKHHIDYLLVPDPEIYDGKTVQNLRYAPSSKPVVDMNHRERKQLLKPLLDTVSMGLMKVDRNWLGNIESWNKPLARCELPLNLQGHSSESFMWRRTEKLDQLRRYCIGGIVGVLR